MAEEVLTVVVKQLAPILNQLASEQIDLLTGVEDKVEDLDKTFKLIQPILSDAEQRQHEEENADQPWLEDLKDISYKIDDLLDEWSYLTLRKQIIESTPTGNVPVWSLLMSYFCNCFGFKQVVWNRDIAVKIKEINGKLDDYVKGTGRFPRNTNNKPKVSQHPTAAFVDESDIVGRQDIRDELVSKLLLGDNSGNNMQILCLVGMGGLGKTTLAQLVYKDDRVIAHFGKNRGWVCVSEPFDVTRVAQQVVEALSSKPSNLRELNSLLEKIKESVSGKRFLLVLDDVWTEDEMDWPYLKASLKHGAPGSAILLTTRKETAARAIGSTLPIHLDVLSESNSWSLFRRASLLDEPNHFREHERDMLRNVGRQIVAKCDGLPLALRIIGTLLRYKTSVAEWEKVNDSRLWHLKVAKDNVFRQLYLSYNDLDPPLKTCFSYCAVFGKDHQIEVDDLVRLWMAQGYLESSSTENDIIEDYGRECFQNLALRSFFQEFKRDEYNRRIIKCKMHDIVHDFAQHIRESECLVIEEEKEVKPLGITRHMTGLGWDEHAITIAFGREILGQTRGVFAECRISEAITSICSLRSLRTLKLKSCEFKQLPSEIGDLIHLRYLYLGRGSVEKLPESMYKLHKLQTLDLSKCGDLRELPLGIEKLKSLRHLAVHEDLALPTGIGELTSLQTLNCLVVGRGYNKLDCLKKLNQLRESIRIYVRGDLDDSGEVKNADLKCKKHIEKLEFKFSWDATMGADAIKAMEPPITLRELGFDDYTQSSLPTWITSLTNLVSLRLSGCFRITSLDTIGKLPSLEKLKIDGLDDLKSIDPAFWGITTSLATTTTLFPKLTELIFSNCLNLECWEDICGGGSSTMMTMMMMIMPHLRCLVIDGCHRFKALPYRFLRNKVSSSSSSLACIEIERIKLNPVTLLSLSEAFSSPQAQEEVEDDDHQSSIIKLVTSLRNLFLGELRRSKLTERVQSKQDYDLLKVAMWLFLNAEELVDVLRDPSPSAVKPILDMVFHIVQCDHSRRESMVDHDILSCLFHLLTNNQDLAIEDVIFQIIQWIIVGNNIHIQAVIDVGFVDPLLNRCKHESSSYFALEAISEMISGASHEQINIM